ncbi:unnamed protein product [Penicillium pancosmium]
MQSFANDSNHQISIQELTWEDISNFSLTMFDNDPNFDRIKDLVMKVVGASDGVFLWARLVVRSLLKSIGYHATEKDLKRKLDLLPKGLDELFDQIPETIDSEDQLMSDQLFLLTIPDFCPWRPAVLNAIAYSWLEDLENPDFPYDLPIQKYTQTEIGVRLERVSCFLDRLSRGLLEMSRKRSGGVDGNDYFSYEVGFLHRSVREYISNTRELQMRDHGPEFDAYSGIFRLQLTEFKFALSTSDDTDLDTWVECAGEAGVLRAKLDDLLLMLAWASSIEKYDIPSRFIEEIGHIVDEYSRMVHTRRQDLPENDIQAFKGHRIWDTNCQHPFHRAWRRRESKHPPDLYATWYAVL